MREGTVLIYKKCFKAKHIMKQYPLQKIITYKDKKDIIQINSKPNYIYKNYENHFLVFYEFWLLIKKVKKRDQKKGTQKL